MNLANSLKKLLDLSKIEDSVANQSKDVYEELITKNFEIISTFLSRITQIYEKQNEFEHCFTTINYKLAELSSITENIHYEFRTTHLAIDKKLNEVAIDYLNLKTQLKTSRVLPSQKHIQQKKISTNVTPQVPKRPKNKSKTFISGEKRHMKNSNSFAQEDSMMVNRGSNFEHELPKNENDNSSLVMETYTNKGTNKRVFFVQHEQPSSPSSSLSCDGSRTIQEDGSSMVSLHFINEIQKQNQDAMSKKMQNIYAEFVEKISKISKDNQAFKSEINKQLSLIPKKQLITSISERAISLHKEIAVINSEICNLKTNLGDIQRQFDRKVSHQYFHESLGNLSNALTSELTQAQKKFSNKIATQNAIQFLENKLNRLIQEKRVSKAHWAQENKLSSLHQSTIKDQMFLKVNECNPKERLNHQKPQTAITRTKNFSQGRFIKRKNSLEQLQSIESFLDLKICDNEKSKQVIIDTTTAGVSQTMTPKHQTSFYKTKKKLCNGESSNAIKSPIQGSTEYLNPIPGQKYPNELKTKEQNKENNLLEKIWKQKAISLLQGSKKKRKK